MSDSAIRPQAASLPAGFQFSQSSLQDFSECRRRFQLRYLMEFAWPAVESEPVLEREQLLERGSRFHRMAQQLFVGVHPDMLRGAAQDEALRGWLENLIEFVDEAGLDSHSIRRAETALSAPVGEYRLLAKYDLIVRSDKGYFTIYDWKTSERRPDRKRLAESLQTRVYPYLVARSAEGMNFSKPVMPDAIEMVYWFAAFPDEPIRFPYSLVQYQEDEVFLTNLIDEIAQLDHFPLTLDDRRCAYCVYRSLCDRGEQAGSLDEIGDDVAPSAHDVGFDFDQIAEIEF